MRESVVRGLAPTRGSINGSMSGLWHHWASHSPYRLWHHGRSAQVRVADGLQALVEVVDQGMPVGMFSPTTASSDIASRYFTSARKLFPCATISTRSPRAKAGAIVHANTAGASHSPSWRFVAGRS